MNFYTFFKSQTKKDCKFFNLTYSEVHYSLSFYRNRLLRSNFRMPALDVRHFQVACYRVVPTDFPKSFYENLYDFLFCYSFRNLVSPDEHKILNDYGLKIISELTSILESENV